MSEHAQALENDPEFLMRCAHTHNWDVLMDFCNNVVMETFLGTPVDSFQESHDQRVEAAMRQLTSVDQWGNNALHACCYHRPPVCVVAALLNAASAVPRNGQQRRAPIQIHLVRARDGSTPLQVASACGASLPVLRRLLYPPDGLWNGGGLVMCLDCQGLGPLSELTLQYALERQQTLHSRTNNPPLEEVNLLHANIGQDNDELSPSPLLNAFWNKVDLLLRAAWSADPLVEGRDGQLFVRRSCRRHGQRIQPKRSTGWVSILHAAAKIAGMIPETLFDVICRSYPHLIGYADSQSGRLPLHVAIDFIGLDRGHRDGSGTVRQFPLINFSRNLCIGKLVDLYPAAVRTKVDGRSTLCRAIAAGVPWSIATKDVKGPLCAISEVEPEAILERDSETQLYPFLLAASVAESLEGVTEDDSITVITLGNIYHLLRIHPQLLTEIRKGQSGDEEVP